MRSKVIGRVLFIALIVVLSLCAGCFLFQGGGNDGGNGNGDDNGDDNSGTEFGIGEDLGKWQVVKGNWETVNLDGEYVLTELGTGTGAGTNEAILFPYELPGSYVISGEIQFAKPAQWAGIVFEAGSNSENEAMYYLVRIMPEKSDGNGLQFVVWDGTKAVTSYATPWQVSTGNFDWAGRWIRFEIERTPGRIKTSVDGKELVSEFKENMDVCKGGLPGFYANQSSSIQQIYFRNLEVRELD